MSNGFLLRSYSFTTADFSTPAAGTSGAFVANDFMGMVMRSASAANPAAVRLDLGFARAIDTVAVLECFARTSSGGVSITIGNDSTFATFVESVDATPPGGEYLAASFLRHAVGYFTTATPCRYVLVQVNGDGVFLPQFARALVGTRLQPARNFSFGVARGARDLGEVEFSPRGAMLRRRGRKLRTLGLSWGFLTQVEAEGFSIPLFEGAGETEFILACLNPDADVERNRRLYYGPLEGNLSLTWRAHDLWEKRLQMVSVI
jgi:hypothetical protein